MIDRLRSHLDHYRHVVVHLPRWLGWLGLVLIPVAVLLSCDIEV